MISSDRYVLLALVVQSSCSPLMYVYDEYAAEEVEETAAVVELTRVRSPEETVWGN